MGEICRECGAGEIRVAQTEEERAVVWKGRKAAFAAMGRISPNYIVQDGVIPRTALPRVMSEIERLGAEAGIRVANVFHAGDGNLHPLVLYDRRIEGQEHAAEDLANRILELCIEAGRLDHGRARRGRREENDDVENVCGARPGNDAASALRV